MTEKPKSDPQDTAQPTAAWCIDDKHLLTRPPSRSLVRRVLDGAAVSVQALGTPVYWLRKTTRRLSARRRARRR